MSKFIKGSSGNPNGKPAGIPNKNTALKRLLESRATELVEKVIEQALHGEPNAIRLCLDRLLPRVKDEPISLNLPNDEPDQVASLLLIGTNVIKAVSIGELTPEAGQKMMSIVEAQRKTIETHELTLRVTALERTIKYRGEN